MNPASILDQSDARPAPATRDDGALRAHVHGGWAAVATAWGDRADYVDARVAGVTEAPARGRGHPSGRARARARVRSRRCRAGRGGARRARTGEVVISDVVAEMTSIAAARAKARGLGNVRTRVLDLEEIAEPDASFDVVLCREGLMFAADPARAAREIRRVLRPGGRVAISVWGPRERNPWLGVVMDAVSAQTGRPIPPPGVPGPFSLGDSDALAVVLRDAGLADVVVGEQPTPLPRGLVRAVVGDDLRPCRPALEDPRGSARAGLAGIAGTPAGSDPRVRDADRRRAPRSRADRRRTRVAASRARRSGRIRSPRSVACVPLEERMPTADDASVCSLKREGR